MIKGEIIMIDKRNWKALIGMKSNDGYGSDTIIKSANNGIIGVSLTSEDSDKPSYITMYSPLLGIHAYATELPRVLNFLHGLGFNKKEIIHKIKPHFRKSTIG